MTDVREENIRTRLTQGSPIERGIGDSKESCVASEVLANIPIFSRRGRSLRGFHHCRIGAMHGPLRKEGAGFSDAKKVEESSSDVKQEIIQARDSIPTTMIQRTLLRQSKALGSCIRSSPRTSLARPQFRPANLSSAPSSRAFTSSRWLGAEEGAKKEEGEATAEEGNKGGEEDPVKKELEAKNREIIDLKVSFILSPNILRIHADRNGI
jgi:hypothetical protein